jgi:hypothetical protein
MSAYYGHPSAHIENDHLRVDFLTHAGPRIVGLRVKASAENIFAETPSIGWDAPRGMFHLYGGHRLWIAPEKPDRTYVPDDDGVIVTPIDQGIELTGKVDSVLGIRKRLSLTLDRDHARAEITHRIDNLGSSVIDLAPWAITQLPHGGRSFLPQTIGVFPPDDPNAAFLPNRHLVLWNYTRIHDPRLHLDDTCVTLDALPLMPPIKIGYLNTPGWAAYLRGDVLFIKRFDPCADRLHSDRNTNVTVYCNDQFAELETLGALSALQPGDHVEHVERWEVIAGVDPSSPFEQIIRICGAD